MFHETRQEAKEIGKQRSEAMAHNSRLSTQIRSLFMQARHCAKKNPDRAAELTAKVAELKGQKVVPPEQPIGYEVYFSGEYEGFIAGKDELEIVQNLAEGRKVTLVEQPFVM